jgi:hypothetical protein
MAGIFEIAFPVIVSTPAPAPRSNRSRSSVVPIVCTGTSVCGSGSIVMMTSARSPAATRSSRVTIR